MITYRKSFGENICRSQRHRSGVSGADLVKTIVHLELRSLLPEGLGGRPSNDWWRRKKTSMKSAPARDINKGCTMRIRRYAEEVAWLEVGPADERPIARVLTSGDQKRLF